MASFKVRDDAGRPAGPVPLGWGGGRHPAASRSVNVVITTSFLAFLAGHRPALPARPSGIPRDAPDKVGEFERQLGNLDASIAAESKAIAGHPKYAVAYGGRARAYFEKRDFAACRADATKVIELLEAKGGMARFLDFERPPEHYIACYRLRGLANAWEAKWDPAFADLAAAVKLSPNDAGLEVERATLYEKAKRPKDAIASRLRAGMLFADGGSKVKAEEQATALKRLGATREAAQVEAKLASQKPKSDLPD